MVRIHVPQCITHRTTHPHGDIMAEDDPLKILKEGKQADMFADYDGPMQIEPALVGNHLPPNLIITLVNQRERIERLEQQVRDLLAINATRK